MRVETPEYGDSIKNFKILAFICSIVWPAYYYNDWLVNQRLYKAKINEVSRLKLQKEEKREPKDI